MDHKYARINEEPRERLWLWRTTLVGEILIGAILIAALSSLATYGVIRAHDQHYLTGHTLTTSTAADAESNPQQFFSCGETFDEAHQRGCTFDPLTLTWLHPECSHYGEQEFLGIGKTTSDGQWQYYYERGGGKTLGGYEALSYLPAGAEYYTTQEEHLHHCMWMLMRVHDAAITGKRLDTKTSSREHTKHCLEMLLGQAKIAAGSNLSNVSVHGIAMDIGWPAC